MKICWDGYIFFQNYRNRINSIILIEKWSVITFNYIRDVYIVTKSYNLQFSNIHPRFVF